MEWPKLKNIVLCILVLTNLFLGVMVARRDLQDSALRSQARENAIQFLEDHGIQAEESRVPHQMTLLPQTVSRDLGREALLAARLLGGTVQAASLGGEVYRYFNDNGSLQFHNDGAFQGEFVPGFFPVGENREEDCRTALDKLDFQGELTAAGTDSLTFRQTWEGQPLFGQEVTLLLEEGSVTAMTGGRRLVGQPTQDASRSAITVPTALIRFFDGLTQLNAVCSRIDGITEGYVSGGSLSGPMTLTPVWHIATDTGTYQMDLVTGALRRLN